MSNIDISNGVCHSQRAVAMRRVWNLHFEGKGGNMEVKVTLRLLPILLFLLSPSISLGAAHNQTKDKQAPTPLIVENVTRALVDLDIEQYFELNGVSRRGDEVIAYPNGMTQKALYTLLCQLGFRDDAGRASWSHHGCGKSLRWPDRPSLQVTFFPDHLELDLDRIGPIWSKGIFLTAPGHFFLEVLPHFFFGTITDQDKMKQALAHWEARRSRKIAKTK